MSWLPMWLKTCFPVLSPIAFRQKVALYYRYTVPWYNMSSCHLVWNNPHLYSLGWKWTLGLRILSVRTASGTVWEVHVTSQHDPMLGLPDWALLPMKEIVFSWTLYIYIYIWLHNKIIWTQSNLISHLCRPREINLSSLHNCVRDVCLFSCW